jgi:LuxR family quorum-sensing transcriptional regulator LasR
MRITMFCDFLTSASILWDAQDEKSWAAALTELGRQYGFDRTLFAVLPRPGLGLPDVFLKSNYPDAWRKTYDKRSFAQIDPTVRHMLTHYRPLIWGESTFQTVDERDLYDQACEYGIKGGIIFPVHGPRQEAGMLCLVTGETPNTALRRELDSRLPALTVLRDVAFDSALPFVTNHLRSVTPKLTRRERECLKWMASGKTTWEMARILNCSEATINYHVTNIRGKFGVTSKVAATLKAASMGLLDSP